jgi:hypothetical protein
MGKFTLCARVLSVDGGGGFTATVSALPLEHSQLAEVRAQECESRQAAALLLGGLAERLELELARRGDLVVRVEYP